MFGLSYRVIAAAATGLLAPPAGGLHIIGAILFPLGVASILIGGPGVIVLPIASSLVVIAAVSLFAVIVLRHRKA